jgi:hypothetical protein
VADQDRLRPSTAVPDLDAFVEFLTRLEALFGPSERPREISRGEHFLL